MEEQKGGESTWEGAETEKDMKGLLGAHLFQVEGIR